MTVIHNIMISVNANSVAICLKFPSQEKKLKNCSDLTQKQNDQFPLCYVKI